MEGGQPGLSSYMYDNSVYVHVHVHVHVHALHALYMQQVRGSIAIVLVGMHNNLQTSQELAMCCITCMLQWCFPSSHVHACT